MSAIGSIGASCYALGSSGGSHRRPSATETAEALFSKLDSSGQGYIDKATLQAALEKVGETSGTSTTDVDTLFSELDGDGDGKVTESEFSKVLQSLSQSLDEQFAANRVQGAMPPPPPPSGDTGFTKDELTQQLEEIGSTDSKRSTLISSIVDNFEAADADSDGKVSFEEAMSFEQSSSQSATTSESSSTSVASTQSGQNDDAKLYLQLMRLMEAYSGFGDENSASSLISTMA